jgi:hypothetical protein
VLRQLWAPFRPGSIRCPTGRTSSEITFVTFHEMALIDIH